MDGRHAADGASGQAAGARGDASGVALALRVAELECEREALQAQERALVQVRAVLERLVEERTADLRAQIAERARAEASLRRTQAELAHVARVTSLGELSASLAHELSQPLATAVTHAGAAERWLSAMPPNLERARHSVQLIAREGQRAGEMLWRMRRLMSRRNGEQVSVALGDLVLEVLAFVRPEAERQGVPIETGLDADLPPVLGVAVELQQVVLSLVMNAVEASLGATAHERPIEVAARADRERRRVVVEVRDRGHGIPAADLERVFEAFYTTKPDGIGLNLAVGRSIAQAHGGDLSARPREGGGMVFTLAVPVAP